MALDPKQLREIRDVFFQDPRWVAVEELILEYINPLLDMTTVDTDQPAEAVKAEIIGRRLAHEKLSQFVSQVGIISNPTKAPIIRPFK